MLQNTLIETGTDFTPIYNEQGLIPCITIDNKGLVLMFAWMNAEALNLTLTTREAHYWSRSRSQLWHKGTTSGHIQKVIEMRIDCDQDCLLMVVEETEAACHTGRKSCFYRAIEKNVDGAIIMKFSE